MAELAAHGLPSCLDRTVRVGEGLYDYVRREYLTLDLGSLDVVPQQSF